MRSQKFLSLWCAFSAASLFSFPSVAAVPAKQNLQRPASILRGSGVVAGGQASGVMSLMDVRRTSSTQTKLERLVLDFGGKELDQKNGVVGYYHAELQDKPARLILELPQTQASRLTAAEINKRLSSSLYIKNSDIQYDASLQSMTMIFQLSQPVQVKITPVRNSKFPGKLVLDMMPLNAKSAARKPTKAANGKATAKGATDSNKARR